MYSFYVFQAFFWTDWTISIKLLLIKRYDDTAFILIYLHIVTIQPPPNQWVLRDPDCVAVRADGTGISHEIKQKGQVETWH